ncbi:MAG: hypothetical protein LT070_00745 [Solirubrobacteraceae bacterium]|nr:hypothetical protein [Solirubrobacteraceae bacterium]
MADEARPRILSVVPDELGDEVYEQLVRYYADEPGVEVMRDRRQRGDRAGGPPIADESPFRGRRRRRVPGDHPPLRGEGPSAA